MRRYWSIWVLSLGLTALPAQAVVTTVAQYRMGEADVGAADGAPAAATTVDSVGGNDLTRFGAPVYTGDGPLRVDTSLAVRFDADVDRYQGAVASTAVDNFGIEAWVRSDGSTTANAVVAYNGNSGSNGWGLFRFGANWAFLYGGIALVDSGEPVTTQWTHLALVRSNGVATMYVNGRPTATFASAPGVPAGGFGIGGNPVFVDFEEFDGAIDEVRVFTFTPGAFVVTDLNLAAEMPIPGNDWRGLSALALALALGGWFALRTRET